MNDIRDSFNYFDSENLGTISMSQLKAILQYVGGGKMPRKDLEKIIQEFIGSPLRVELKDVERIATKIWYEGGQEHERKELFRMFDKKDRGSTTMDEIKNVLQSRVVVPVTDEDIEELMTLLGVDMQTPITLWDFSK